VLRITKIYPIFIYVFPHHYVYLCDLAILGEDAARANLGDSTRLDPRDF
jgi:hypothetical protein